MFVLSPPTPTAQSPQQRPARYALLWLLLLSPAALAEQFQLKSPDGRIEISLETGAQLQYQLQVDGNTVLAPSPISLQFADGIQYGPAGIVLKQSRRSENQLVKPEVPVRTATIRDQYNELALEFDQPFVLRVRAYNEGIAWRFEGRKSGSQVSGKPDRAELRAEIASFHFSAGTFSYFPFEKNFRTATQPSFTPVPAKSIDSAELGSLPALFVSNGVNLLLTETDLQDYPGLWLQGHGDGRIYGVHPKNLDLTKQNPQNPEQTGEFTTSIATVARERNFPWRIIGVARSDAELLNIQLSYLLAEPSRIGKPEWIKPGQIAWDWYNENNFKGVDFKAGINTATYQYYADFAARFGIENILIDDGWSTHDDVLTVLPNIDVQAVIKHAKAKGVAVQLWVPWTGLDKNMEAAMALYKKWGVAGLKIDFMNSDSQSMVNFYWRAAAMAAKYQLMVNFHGSYKPAGIHRTYPNVLTREGVKGLENHKWSDAITPTHNLHLPFIRMIAGPMDYTPGAMRNAQRKDFNAVFSRPMSLGTRAHQLAMFVLYESPLQMLADTPTSYEAEPEIPTFISQIPTVWDNFRVLHASIGEYLVMARQRGNSWYIGGMTNEQARTLPLKLDFLGSGSYQLQLIKDGINADRHAEDYKLEKRLVKAGDSLEIPMAGGGGFAAILTPL